MRVRGIMKQASGTYSSSHLRESRQINDERSSEVRGGDTCTWLDYYLSRKTLLPEQGERDPCYDRSPRSNSH